MEVQNDLCVIRALGSVLRVIGGRLATPYVRRRYENGLGWNRFIVVDLTLDSPCQLASEGSSFCFLLLRRFGCLCGLCVCVCVGEEQRWIEGLRLRVHL